MQSPYAGSMSLSVNELSDESDYEYEYHESETEDFFVDLDLTSLNGPIRPPRQRSTSLRGSSLTANDVSASPGESHIAGGGQNQGDSLEFESDPGAQLQSQVQIMELHSSNPIISYQNQIFSCSWADLIGTSMMFALPDDDPDTPALRKTRDFDLITATRVKILGQKSYITSGPGSTQAERMRAGGTSTGQARFLECLMNVKRAKGETDTIRTVFPLGRQKSQIIEERLQGWARTEGLLAELENLKERAREGDISAIERFEEIYAKFEKASQTGSTLENTETKEETPAPPAESQPETQAQSTPTAPTVG